MYSESTLEGEYTVGKVSVDQLTIRTGWLYGLDGINHVMAMCKLEMIKYILDAVDD